MEGDDREQLNWFRVGDADMLGVGRITTVQAGHYAVCLTRTEAGYGAISNRCAHQGGPLGDGFLQDGCVVCPWHGYQFDNQSGECIYPEAATCRLAVAPEVSLKDGEVIVRSSR